MTITPEMVDAMLSAGLTREQMAAIIKADYVAEQQKEEERLSAKRAGNAERQRRFKAKKKAEQTGQSDSDDSEGNAGNALAELPSVTPVTVVPSSPGSPSPSPQTPNPHPLNPLSPSAREGASAGGLFGEEGQGDEEADRVDPKAKPPPERRATRLPEDWQLTPERMAFARKERLPDEQIPREFARFRDHWLQASGRNAAKRDWDATWRNWVREAVDRLSRARSPQSGGNRSEGGNLLRAYQRAASRYTDPNPYSE